jgi:branched-chain amino acid aminotransferase
VTSPLAWVDGRIAPTDQARLSVADRGFLLGDGVFETLRARRGVVIEWDAHLARLHESSDAMSITLPIADDGLLGGIGELLAALHLDGSGADAALRITISRGSSPARGLLPPGWRSMQATVVIGAWPYEPPPAALLGRGVHAVVSSLRRDPASPLAGVKSTSRADYVFARIEADRAAVDDALFLTLDGRLSETTTANAWLVNARRISTPSRDAAILAGTTRAWLLDIAPGLDVGVAIAEEADLGIADLLAADEAFLSSAVAGIVPLTALEGQAIGSGAPGPLTMAFREARERWIDERTVPT